jgi:hypothetical protein
VLRIGAAADHKFLGRFALHLNHSRERRCSYRPSRPLAITPLPALLARTLPRSPLVKSGYTAALATATCPATRDAQRAPERYVTSFEPEDVEHLIRDRAALTPNARRLTVENTSCTDKFIGFIRVQYRCTYFAAPAPLGGSMADVHLVKS